MQYSSIFSIDNTLASLLELLKDGNVYPRLIGGYVRDKIIGKENIDIDIATPILPEEVMSRLKSAGIAAIPTGIKHGTITAISQGQKFEITTLREDMQCDGRHAKVAFSKSFIQDAFRRDFTINALSYAHNEQTIYDYLGGLQHLQNKQVIFIGKAESRIREDYLRIMRFFRFSAFYANYLDLEGYTACLELSALITELSKERIYGELNKLLLAPNVARVLTKMKPILSLIFTEPYSIERLIKAINIGNSLGIKLDLATLYSALFILAKDSINLKHNLRVNCFSKHLIKQIFKYLTLVNELTLSLNHQLILNTYWVEEPINFAQYLVISVAAGCINEELASTLYTSYQTRIWPGNLPVTGTELQALGYQGQAIGNCLAKLKHFWIQSDFQLTKKELLELVNT